MHENFNIQEIISKVSGGRGGGGMEKDTTDRRDRNANGELIRREGKKTE